MDLDAYSLEDTFLSTTKSESDAEKIYLNLADIENKSFLREKLRYAGI